MNLLDNVAKTEGARKFANSETAALLIQIVVGAATIGALLFRPKTSPPNSSDEPNGQ